MTIAEVNDLMDEYYGVQNYQVLDYIESGGIHHIDTWAKFLDEENVLLKEVWPTHHTYNTLEQRATLLASLRSSTGRNYQVHRVYCYEFQWRQSGFVYQQHHPQRPHLRAALRQRHVRSGRPGGLPHGGARLPGFGLHLLGFPHRRRAALPHQGHHGRRHVARGPRAGA